MAIARTIPVHGQASVEPHAGFSKDKGDLQIQQLLQHLEDHEQDQFNISGMSDRAMLRFKHGQFCVGGEIACNKFVIWPHDLHYVGVDCKHILYGDMSPLQWSCSFIRSVLK